MSRACSTRGEGMHRILVGKQEGKRSLENLDICGRRILE
jgi:hypothetical protein